MKKYIELNLESFEELNEQGQRNAKMYIKQLLKKQGIRATQKAIEEFIVKEKVRFESYGRLFFFEEDDVYFFEEENGKSYIKLFDSKFLYEDGKVFLEMYTFNELTEEVKEFAVNKAIDYIKKYLPHGTVDKNDLINSFITNNALFTANGTQIPLDERNERYVYINNGLYEMQDC